MKKKTKSLGHRHKKNTISTNIAPTVAIGRNFYSKYTPEIHYPPTYHHNND